MEDWIVSGEIHGREVEFVKFDNKDVGVDMTDWCNRSEICVV